MAKSKITTEEFIKRAEHIHGNRYDYHKVNYINTATPVIIVCKIHGEFKQSPNSHISSKSNCRKCVIKESYLTLEEFINRAKEKHNDKFDYSKVEYTHSWDSVKIICPIHGLFTQTANMHLHGHGCIKCGKVVQNSSKENFIKSARKVHGDKFSYEDVYYINNNTKVKILCRKHGPFLQRPTNHISGNGCETCGIENRQLSLNEFIEKCNLIHNHKYDYSQTIYKTSKHVVKIICKQHGEFIQIATSHLQGHGCTLCCTGVSNKEKKWLDSLNIPEANRQYKIKINGRLFKFDGFDPTTNTIYEFYGDYWHGNPKIYKSGINTISKVPYKQLYKETMEREKVLETAGYSIVSIWESDLS